jgi:metal-dependent hydrolase (beta-lactamase superfamily II)
MLVKYPTQGRPWLPVRIVHVLQLTCLTPCHCTKNNTQKERLFEQVIGSQFRRTDRGDKTPLFTPEKL